MMISSENDTADHRPIFISYSRRFDEKIIDAICIVPAMQQVIGCAFIVSSIAQLSFHLISASFHAAWALLRKIEGKYQEIDFTNQQKDVPKNIQI